MFRFNGSISIWFVCGALSLTVGCGKAKKQPQAATAVPKEITDPTAKPVAESVPTTQESPPVNTDVIDPVAAETPTADLVATETPDTNSEETVAVDEPAPVVDPPTNPRPDLDGKPIRVLLPTSAGAMLVDLDIRIDDVSLQQAFSQRIKKVIDDSDTDESKTVTWDELLDHLASDPELFGRNSATNMGQRRNIVQLNDRNRNGLVDEDEAAQYLFRSSNFTKPFRLQGTSYYHDRQGKSRLFAALDRDESGELEASEIDTAAESLLRVDRNTDQRLDISEIIAPPAPNNRDPAWSSRRISRDGSVATDLYGYVDWTMAAYSLSDMIGKRPFSLTTDPFASLDKDENGSISTIEAKSLREADSDLIIRVDLSSTHSDPKLTVLWSESSLQQAVRACRSDSTVAFEGDAMRLCVQVTDRPFGNNQLPPEAFVMLDANKDGFLDEAEIPAPFLQQYSFEDMDADDDGKLTIDEIRDAMRPKSPLWSVQVRGRGAEFPDAVFAFLDQDNNLALNTREILTAADRLRSQAIKGKVRPKDIPNTMMIQLVRGDPMQRNELFVFESRKRTTDPLANAPRWAKSMDANGDGDISKIEFPGKEEAFSKLDINGDGFIAMDELPATSSLNSPN